LINQNTGGGQVNGANQLVRRFPIFGNKSGRVLTACVIRLAAGVPITLHYDIEAEKFSG
jgi:hypothetical protein